VICSVDRLHYAFKFLPRSDAIRKLWPRTDQKLIMHFQRQLQRKQQEGGLLPELGLRADFFEHAQKSFTGNLQMTAPRGMLGANIDAVLTKTYTMFVAPPEMGARPINYQSLAPYRLRNKVWTAFEERGLLGRAGVEREAIINGKHFPWTFDLAYRNGRANVINTIALNSGIAEINLGRALVYKGMVEEISNAHGVRATAVVELQRVLADHAPGASEAQKLLSDADIRVVPIDRLDRFVIDVEAELKRSRSS